MHGIMHPARAAHHLLAVLALCGLVVALLPGAAEPRSGPRTLEYAFTEHFAIHFHQGETGLAVELAQSAEEIHDLLVPFMEWERPSEPRWCSLTLPTAPTATRRPSPTARSSSTQRRRPRVQPRQLRALALGLRPRICAFSRSTRRRIPVLRQILGRVIMPGGVLPRWMTEGFATCRDTLQQRRTGPLDLHRHAPPVRRS